MVLIHPLASVLMPVYNAEKYVAEAVESVLNQTFEDFELVIIDDGSTDDSMGVVRRYERDPRVRIVPGPRAGFSRAVNAGIEAARGRYLTECDADDWLPVDRLAWQWEWVKEHPEFGGVCGVFSSATPQGEVIGELGELGEAVEITEELRRGEIRTSFCTYLVKSDLVRSRGGMRPYFSVGPDLDLQLRLGESARIWYEPRNTYFYRLHDASITHTQRKQRVEFFDRMAREFQRQRLETGTDDLERGCPPEPPDDGEGVRGSVKQQLQGHMVGSAWRTFANGRRWEAMKLMVRAIGVRPRAFAPWRGLAMMTLRVCFPKLSKKDQASG